MIHVEGITKEFKIYQRPKGVGNAIKSIFKREYTMKCAVDDISFDIADGEIVGYVGPNGAGKSTTIKMLSGILAPTSGIMQVNGIEPHKQRVKNASNIGVIFGQRSQLYWDLPVRDSFLLHKRIYDIPDDIYTANVAMFTDMLAMGDFIGQPVRQLSLGQKMRANIAISLLHNPKIVYLDEPTIGLDIVAKASIRKFILELNKAQGTTFLVTTHDMNDIEEVCQRLILIDHGRKQYDGALASFKQRFGEAYTIAVKAKNGGEISHPHMSFAGVKDGASLLTGDKNHLSIAQAVDYLVKHYDIEDIDIQDSDVESILKKMYEGGADHE